MALIDELKLRLAATLDERNKAADEHHKLSGEIDDLDRAIAALTPTEELISALEFEAEKAVAREQLEREPEIPETWETMERAEQGEVKTVLLSNEQDDASEFISDLTGDPAIEPEAGLHGEPTDLQGDTVPELQQAFDEIFGAQEERPALNEQMQDEREQGYAHVTNPEADAIARAHDYYSPEKVAERNRFNPFAMFRREPEGV